MNNHEQWKELSLAVMKFGVSTQEAAQSINEFSEVLKSIKNRYHPVVWWLYTLVYR